MDENGLPITGAGVNYSSVEAISQRELITYVNLFLVRTCAFLNNFSTKCETKLADLHSRLETINMSITLLETKLDSVEELRNIKLEDNQEQQTSSENAPSAAANLPETAQASNVTAQATANVVAAPPAPPLPPPPAPEQPPVVEQAPVITVSQDERFSKYFKMLKMGVAEEALRLKMRSEGVDPNILNDPNAPAPPAPPKDSSDSSDSEDDDD